jgi:hypothetical protein
MNLLPMPFAMCAVMLWYRSYGNSTAQPSKPTVLAA